jgi:tight adherence protein B
MRRFPGTLLAVLLALVVAPAGMALAQTDGENLRIDKVDVTGHPEVEVTVSAPTGDSAGETITVTEDGEQRAVEIEQAPSADLQVVLLLDVTGSMGGGPLAAAKQAATAFLDRLPDDVRLAVVSYDTEATLVSGFEASRDEHADGIDGLEAGGETAMYDAVVSALDLFPDAAGDASRALVLLTDGEDNASRAELEDVVDRLASSGVLLRGVEYQTAYSESAGIQAMAEATGGDVVGADDPEALVGVYEQLAADLLSRYTLRYTSTSNGTIGLEVELRRGDTALSATRTIELPEPKGGESEEAVPAPRAPQPEPASPRASTSAWLIVGAVLWFIALAVLLSALFAPRERRAQLAGVGARMRRSGSATHDLADHVTALASRTLNQRGYQRGLNAALERAGITLRPEEFVVLVGCATFTAFAVGFVLSGFLAGMALSLATVVFAKVHVWLRTTRRQAKFAEQLSDTLQMLSGSLRAGYSLMQAIDAVAREADAPTSEEFGRLVVETRLGRNINDALEAMAHRMGGDDLNWVAQAIQIHREVGGDLAEVLDTVAGTIRERDQIRRQVKALSAEGRLSGWVLLALPMGVGGFIFLTNRPYLAVLTTSLVGWGMLAFLVILLTVGGLWIRHLVKLEF